MKNDESHADSKVEFGLWHIKIHGMHPALQCGRCGKCGHSYNVQFNETGGVSEQTLCVDCLGKAVAVHATRTLCEQREVVIS